MQQTFKIKKVHLLIIAMAFAGIGVAMLVVSLAATYYATISFSPNPVNANLGSPASFNLVISSPNQSFSSAYICFKFNSSITTYNSFNDAKSVPINSSVKVQNSTDHICITDYPPSPTTSASITLIFNTLATGSTNLYFTSTSLTPSNNNGISITPVNGQINISNPSPSLSLSCGSASTSSINLNYSYSSASNVTLFRGGAKIASFGGSSGSGSFTDSGLSAGTSYNYTLNNGTSSTSTPYATSTCNTTTPAGGGGGGSTGGGGGGGTGGSGSSSPPLQGSSGTSSGTPSTNQNPLQPVSPNGSTTIDTNSPISVPGSDNNTPAQPASTLKSKKLNWMKVGALIVGVGSLCSGLIWFLLRKLRSGGQQHVVNEDIFTEYNATHPEIPAISPLPNAMPIPTTGTTWQKHLLPNERTTGEDEPPDMFELAKEHPESFGDTLLGQGAASIKPPVKPKETPEPKHRAEPPKPPKKAETKKPEPPKKTAPSPPKHHEEEGDTLENNEVINLH